MTRKLDDSAFAYYLALGPTRGHKAVADHYGCSKKAVTNKAVQENWKARVAEHEREQREAAEKKARESIDGMYDRHLKVASFIQGKAIESLKAIPLDNAMDAVRAYKLAAEMEQSIRGKPSTQGVIELERKIRAEHENWSPEPDEQEVDGDEPGDAQAPAV